eukprot:6797376-Prymnesium_polylepis.1
MPRPARSPLSVRSRLARLSSLTLSPHGAKLDPLARGVDFWGLTSRVKRLLPIDYDEFRHAHNTQKYMPYSIL